MVDKVYEREQVVRSILGACVFLGGKVSERVICDIENVYRLDYFYLRLGIFSQICPIFNFLSFTFSSLYFGSL